MDPYLETYWRDVHHRLITYACDTIQLALPDELLARTNERVFLETDQDGRSIYPDVEIIEESRSRNAAASTALLDVAEPILVATPSSEPAPQGFIEIVDTRSGNRIVTVIEFLSPSNKLAGEGRELYLQKQREVLESGAALVEIDLTRAGRRMMMLAPEQIPRKHRKTYQILVHRPWKPKVFALYPISIRDRLPKIAIPLRETDQEIALDIQALIDQVYINGRYHKLDYRQTLEPPLGAEDAAWADELLRAAGNR
jgi:hypothetical protein